MLAERLGGLAPALAQAVVLARQAPGARLQRRGPHHQGDPVSWGGGERSAFPPEARGAVGAARGSGGDSPLHAGSGRLCRPHCLEIQSRYVATSSVTLMILPRMLRGEERVN